MCDGVVASGVGVLTVYWSKAASYCSVCCGKVGGRKCGIC